MSLDYSDAVRLIRKGRRAEQRGKAVEGCVTALITFVLGSFLKGWLFMLAVGIAHLHWLPQLPTIGFWWAVLLMAVMPSLAPTSTSKDRSS